MNTAEIQKGRPRNARAHDQARQPPVASARPQPVRPRAGSEVDTDCPGSGKVDQTTASGSLPAPRPLPGSTPVIGHGLSTAPRARSGRGGPPSSRRHHLNVPRPLTPESPSRLRLQDLHRFHGLHREQPGSALPQCLTTRQASLHATDRSVASPKGLSTLGSALARFQTGTPACYRAPWQLPGPDFHRQATTSFRSGHDRWTITSMLSGRTGCSTSPARCWPTYRSRTAR